MTVDYATGEIVESTELATVDASSELAVTSYLQQARDWLATAVESTGPEQIARAKAEIATAAEATKQLGLSRDIREDATEMVRRAEYALGKAIRKGQEEGTIRTRSDNDRDASVPSTKASPSDFASDVELYDRPTQGKAGILSIADNATPEEFDAALAEARDEGNLSRANVARKVRADDPTERKHQEAELINAFRALLRNLTPKNVSTLSPKARGHLVAILRDTITKLEG